MGVTIFMVGNSTTDIFDTKEVIEKGNIIINHDKKLIIEHKEETRESRSNFEEEKSGVMTLPIEDVNQTIVIGGL